VDAKKGTILTANHVAAGAEYLEIRTFSGQCHEVKVWEEFPETDLAVLYTGHAIRAMSAKISTQTPDIGDEVIICGSPWGFRQFNSVSTGIISAKWKEIWELLPGVLCYQATAATLPGNSGGPWFDKSGRLIGIMSMGLSGTENFGWAIPLNRIMDVVTGDVYNGK